MVASEIAYDRVSGHDGILTIANQINLAMIVGNTMQPFHLAVPVRDVAIARQFYKEVIGCTEGRSDTRWVDFDLFGHQFVIHQKDDLPITPRELRMSSRYLIMLNNEALAHLLS